VDIVDTRIQGKTAIVSVKYIAKIAEYEENVKSKKAVKNVNKKAKSIQTIWTWAKPLDSRDPNWELEEINALS
jgi:predicted lipid-binding transport protein (Tim44 family)